MVNQAYLNQEKNCFFCSKLDCDFCQKTSQYEEELRDKKFNTANSHIQNWFIIYFLKDNDRISIFPVKKEMTEKLTIKCFANNDFAKEPVQASEDAAGYDLYAAEDKTLFPHSCSGLTIE